MKWQELEGFIVFLFIILLMWVLIWLPQSFETNLYGTCKDGIVDGYLIKRTPIWFFLGTCFCKDPRVGGGADTDQCNL